MQEIRPNVTSAIIEAAFDVFRTNPGAGLGEVAARAGVGRATLHRHFKGRADLIATLARIASDDIDAAVTDAIEDATSATEMLRLIIEAIIPLGDRQSFLALERIDAPDIATKTSQQAAEFAELIEAARREGLFAADIPTPWIIAVYDQLIFAAWMQIKAGELTQKQAAALGWRTFTAGLGPHKDPVPTKGDMT
jgi:TetR/AcrR family transcriptional repressor of mexCD-oprJ operon